MIYTQICGCGLPDVVCFRSQPLPRRAPFATVPAHAVHHATILCRVTDKHSRTYHAPMYCAGLHASSRRQGSDQPHLCHDNVGSCHLPAHIGDHSAAGRMLPCKVCVRADRDASQPVCHSMECQTGSRPRTQPQVITCRNHGQCRCLIRLHGYLVHYNHARYFPSCSRTAPAGCASAGCTAHIRWAVGT
jgi:hypothetical protein